MINNSLAKCFITIVCVPLILLFGAQTLINIQTQKQLEVDPNIAYIIIRNIFYFEDSISNWQQKINQDENGGEDLEDSVLIEPQYEDVILDHIERAETRLSLLNSLTDTTVVRLKQELAGGNDSDEEAYEKLSDAELGSTDNTKSVDEVRISYLEGRSNSIVANGYMVLDEVVLSIQLSQTVADLAVYMVATSLIQLYDLIGYLDQFEENTAQNVFYILIDRFSSGIELANSIQIDLSLYLPSWIDDDKLAPFTSNLQKMSSNFSIGTNSKINEGKNQILFLDYSKIITSAQNTIETVDINQASDFTSFLTSNNLPLEQKTEDANSYTVYADNEANSSNDTIAKVNQLSDCLIQTMLLDQGTIFSYDFIASYEEITAQRGDYILNYLSQDARSLRCLLSYDEINQIIFEIMTKEIEEIINGNSELGLMFLLEDICFWQQSISINFLESLDVDPSSNY